ncbi:MAG: S8 family serine peptidase, partial [Caldisericia bacterium]|nr:S8 family serine peptidase [Caldisericia bacterium]
MKQILITCTLVFSLIVSGILSVQSVYASESIVVDSSVSEKMNSTSLVPVIVELDQPCVIESTNSAIKSSFYKPQFEKDSIDYSFQPFVIDQQKEFINKLKKNGISFIDKNESCSIITNSISIDIKGTDIEKLLSIPGVKEIVSNEKVFFPTRYNAAQTTHVLDAWKGIAENRETKGQGVKVGILDTGLDTTHEDFQKRVKGGHDFGDGDKDFNDKVGHGTHVAGIIAGRSNSNRVAVGMAPEAYLYIYKVFSSSSPGANTQHIVQAVERSVKDKCDVINLSLGHESGDAATVSNYYANSMRNANEAGVMVVVAASNDGSRGKKQKYAIGSPGTIDTCFCVAATDDRSSVAFTVKSGEKTKKISALLAQYSPSFSKEISDAEIVNCGYGFSEDFEGKKLYGKIAIVQRGPIGAKALSFRKKLDNARDADAAGLIIYNHTSGDKMKASLIIDKEDPESVELIPTCTILKKDGQWIIAEIENEENESDKVSAIFSGSAGSTIATFSSQGSGSDGWFKPEIATPGTNILSTVPRNSYGLASGTSMASPVMAGLVALLKDVRPKWTNQQIKSAFMNTADMLINEDNGLPVTFSLQGAGQARLDKAITTKAFINPPAMVVKDNEILPYQSSSSSPVKLTFTSTQKKEISLDISYEIFLLESEESPVELILSKETLSLPAGQSGVINVSFNVDRESMQHSLYEGIIKAGDMHVPFIVYRDKPSKEVLAISDIVVEPEELVFSEEESTKDVSISFSLNSGTEQNWNGYSGGCAYSNYGTITFSIVDDYGENWGTIASFSSMLIGYYQFKWNGRNEQGDFILAEGKYHIEVMIKNWTYKGNQIEYFFDTYEAKKDMEVVESIVPKPGTLIGSVEKILSVDELFEIFLVVKEAKDVIGIEFEFTYNGEKLSCDGVEDADFLGSDGADVEIDEEIDDGEDGYGKVSLFRYAEKGQQEGVSGSYVRIAKLVFDPLDDGKMKVKLFNCKLFYADGSVAKL